MAAELTEEAKQALQKEIQKRLSIVFAVSGAVVAAAIAVMSWQLSEIVSEAASQSVKKELSKSISTVENEVKDFRDRMANALRTADEVQQTADELKRRVAKVSEDVDRLTTDEINLRLTEVDTRLSRLSGRLDTLGKIINPKNAQDILNVARMAEEITARENFEETIRASVAVYGKRLDRIESTVASIQFWIWAGLLAIIGALFGTVTYLFKQLGKYLTPSSPVKEDG